MTSARASAAPSAAARLCTACGACCNGTLFDEVPLEREEISLGPRLGLPIVTSGDAAAMPLPCPRLAGASCTIYADRPSTCRSYRCGLLEDLEAGEVSLDEALGAVADLARAAAAVRAELPAGAARRPLLRAADEVAEACGGRRSAAFLEGRASLAAALDRLGPALRAVTRRAGARRSDAGS